MKSLNLFRSGVSYYQTELIGSHYPENRFLKEKVLNQGDKGDCLSGRIGLSDCIDFIKEKMLQIQGIFLFVPQEGVFSNHFHLDLKKLAEIVML